MKDYRNHPDPLVKSLSEAHHVAVREGERAVAKSLEAHVGRLTDDAYGMYAALREAERVIDQFRYHHGIALSNITTSPTSRSGLGSNGDEWLAILASKLTQARVDFEDRKGWSS